MYLSLLFTYPTVKHTDMPHDETARMKALRQKKNALLDQVVAIDIELARLVEHEQRKVFAAFKRDVGDRALNKFFRESQPSLDIASADTSPPLDL